VQRGALTRVRLRPCVERRSERIDAQVSKLMGDFAARSPPCGVGPVRAVVANFIYMTL